MAFQPMRGVRIIEVAQYTFTPSAGAVLADWGADVIKVEHAVTGDAQRGLTLGVGGAAVGSFQPLMEHPNRGKRSIGLALEQEEARQVLYDLAKTADVFLVNFLPGARQKLKIDVEHIRAVNPNIVYARGSAFGNQGGERLLGGYDMSAFWCRSGSAWGATPPDAPRLISQPAGAYGDSMGGMTIAGGISAALFARERTGETCELDVSLLSLGTWAMALSVGNALLTGEVQPPMSFKDVSATFNPLVGTYRTSDERYINFTMLQAGRYWADTCRHLGLDELIEDPRFATVQALMTPENTAVAAQIISDTIATRPFAEWVERFRSLEGQWAPVQNPLELAADPQVRANGFIRPVVDVEGNERELVANPVQFDNTPPEIKRAPQFAEHTDEILGELGLDMDQIIELKLTGAVT
jgi:crotonobetainyl-CoA:carnitine CoA-transferase CaiB-like acyl-CoA transferase